MFTGVCEDTQVLWEEKEIPSITEIPAMGGDKRKVSFPCSTKDSHKESQAGLKKADLLKVDMH